MNDKTGKELWACSKDYHILTNKKFTELAELAANTFGMKIAYFATLNGGKKVMAAFERPDKPFHIGQWEVKTHLIFINSHDGTKGFEIGVNNGLHRCKNMFTSTVIETKLRHNSGMADAIQELEMRILGVDQKLQTEFEEINRWQDVRISPEILTQAKEQLFNLGGRELSTTEQNKLARFDMSMETERNALGEDNIFTLFMAGTHFTTHNYSANGGLQWDRDFPLWGQRANLNRKLHKICANLAAVHA